MKAKSFVLCLLALTTAYSQSVPTLMNFQSTVTDANGARIGNTAPENREVTLRIYDAAQGGNVIYAERQIATIANGDFSLLLGAGDNVGVEPRGALQAAFNGASRFLGVTVDDGTNAADVEISPRQQIVSTAFAFTAQNAQSVPAANVMASLGANGITADGTRVGINAPAIASQPEAGKYRLTVRGDNTDPTTLANQLVVQTEGNSGQRKLFMGYHNTGNYGSIQSYDEAVGPSKLVLNPAGGNVGIGTTNPIGRFHVLSNGATSTNVLQAAPVGNSFVDQVFVDRTGNIRAALQLAGANGDMVASSQTNDFFVRGTGRLFLQTGLSSGPGVGISLDHNNRVGLNATVPSAQLDVFANGVPAAIFQNGNVGVNVDAAGATRSLTVGGAGPQLRVVNSSTQKLDVAVESNGGSGTGGAGHASIQASDGGNLRSLRLNPLGGPVSIGTGSNDTTPLGVSGAGPQFKIMNSANEVHRLEMAAISGGASNVNAIGTLQTAGGVSNILSLNPNGGNVGIGTANPNFNLEVNGNMNVQLGVDAGVSAVADYGLQCAGMDHKQLRLTRPGVGSWDLFVNGNNRLYFRSGITGIDPNIDPSTGAYSQSSDSRLKKDIVELDGVLDKVMQMRPVTYHFNQQQASDKKSIGFLAQEIEPLFPSVVNESTDGYKSMAYAELVPVAIGAVKEVNLKTQRLETENADLKDKVSELEKRLATIELLLEKKAD